MSVVTIVGVTVENNKYHINSMTLRFSGAPTVKQALITAKRYAIGCSVKPDFNSKNLEVHMVPDGELTKVQFYPCVCNTISR